MGRDIARFRFLVTDADSWSLSSGEIMMLLSGIVEASQELTRQSSNAEGGLSLNMLPGMWCH